MAGVTPLIIRENIFKTMYFESSEKIVFIAHKKFLKIYVFLISSIISHSLIITF